MPGFHHSLPLHHWRLPSVSQNTQTEGKVGSTSLPLLIVMPSFLPAVLPSASLLKSLLTLSCLSHSPNLIFKKDLFKVVCACAYVRACMCVQVPKATEARRWW